MNQATILYGPKASGKTHYALNKLTRQMDVKQIITADRLLAKYEKPTKIPFDEIYNKVLIIDECQKDFPLHQF